MNSFETCKTACIEFVLVSLVDRLVPWHDSPLFFWRARSMEQCLMGRPWTHSPFLELNQAYIATAISGIVQRAGQVYRPGWSGLPIN